MPYNNKSLNGESLLGKAMGMKNYVKKGVKKAVSNYKAAYKRENDKYLATPAGKKAKAVLKAGGGM